MYKNSNNKVKNVRCPLCLRVFIPIWDKSLFNLELKCWNGISRCPLGEEETVYRILFLCNFFKVMVPVLVYFDWSYSTPKKILLGLSLSVKRALAFKGLMSVAIVNMR